MVNGLAQVLDVGRRSTAPIGQFFFTREVYRVLYIGRTSAPPIGQFDRVLDVGRLTTAPIGASLVLDPP